MASSSLRLRPATRTSRSAFTLIELLTVIAIIGILAAIIIPTVTTVREKAKSIQCGVRVRQWGVAAMLYANDHKGYYDVIGLDSTGKNALWCQVSGSGAGGSGGIYIPYLSGGNTKNYADWQQCPSSQGLEEYAAASSGGANTPAYTAYVLSLPHVNNKTIIAGSNGQISVALSKASQPSHTILLIERPYTAGGAGQDTGANATIDKDKNLFTIFSNATRHNKNTQVVFMDGHVKAMKIDDMSIGSGRGASFDNTLLQLY